MGNYASANEFNTLQDRVSALETKHDEITGLGGRVSTLETNHVGALDRVSALETNHNGVVDRLDTIEDLMKDCDETLMRPPVGCESKCDTEFPLEGENCSNDDDSGCSASLLSRRLWCRIENKARCSEVDTETYLENLNLCVRKWMRESGATCDDDGELDDSFMDQRLLGQRHQVREQKGQSKQITGRKKCANLWSKSRIEDAMRLVGDGKSPPTGCTTIDGSDNEFLRDCIGKDSCPNGCVLMGLGEASKFLPIQTSFQQEIERNQPPQSPQAQQSTGVAIPQVKQTSSSDANSLSL